ncbi:hypothetical protein [Paenibacillus elgii]|uniref:hypothetical protein n=1 Tax=Paenibacillus elgii TaxID=189691 RepID=UPI00204007AC|nr:hypothetical protein [Paenibacillus elgii]MCM3273909.1 hypothetical protein [Paenibacillus elgii]
MFKFGTIGAYKQVRNNPRCKATIDLKNGMVVIPNEANKTAPTPATATLAKGDVYVVYNIIDQPEIRSTEDFVIPTGDHVRAFRLADLVGLPVEISDAVIKDSYSGLAKGDKLVPCDDATDATNKGMWKKDATTASDYKVNLEIIEKTPFGDKGLFCKVVVN